MQAKTYRFESKLSCFSGCCVCLFICHKGTYISTEHLSWTQSLARIRELVEMGYTYANDYELDAVAADYIERVCQTTR